MAKSKDLTKPLVMLLDKTVMASITGSGTINKNINNLYGIEFLKETLEVKMVNVCPVLKYDTGDHTI